MDCPETVLHTAAAAANDDDDDDDGLGVGRRNDRCGRKTAT